MSAPIQVGDIVTPRSRYEIGREWTVIGTFRAAYTGGTKVKWLVLSPDSDNQPVIVRRSATVRVATR